MPPPLPIELRERVVAHHKETGEGRVLLGRHFRVGSSTAYRWLVEEAKTGSLQPKTTRRGPQPKIPDSCLAELRALIAEKVDRTLKELCVKWEARCGVLVDDATMHRALVRAGISLKKRQNGLATERVLTSLQPRSRSVKK